MGIKRYPDFVTEYPKKFCAKIGSKKSAPIIPKNEINDVMIAEENVGILKNFKSTIGSFWDFSTKRNAKRVTKETIYDRMLRMSHHPQACPWSNTKTIVPRLIPSKIDPQISKFFRPLICFTVSTINSIAISAPTIPNGKLI